MAAPKKKKKVAPIVSKEPTKGGSGEIDTLLASLNKQFKGRAIVRDGSDIVNTFILRRPTGITTLDLALGGGLPAGGMTQIIGKYSSGKSYLCNRVMSQTQEIYGADAAVAVCMTEMRFDKRFAKEHCGVNISYSQEEIDSFIQSDREKGLPPPTEETLTWWRSSTGRFVEAVAQTAEGILEMAAQIIASNKFQVVMIDSFGALLTAAEAEAEEGLEQKHRGGAAMVVTQFMHRLHAALNLPDEEGKPNTTTVIGINQYRDNVNAGLYGNPMKVAGGNALAHGKLVDIHIEQGKKHKIQAGASYVTVGKEIHWEIMKGKAGCHDGPKGTYNFYFGKYGHGFGVDVLTDLMVAGLQAGIIEQNGAWYSMNGNKLGQGKEAAALALYQSPELAAAVRMGVFRQSGLSFLTKMGE